MSINQFSSELLPETIWWAQQQLMNPNIPTTTNTSSISPQNHHHHHHNHPSWFHSAMFPPQNPSHHNFNLNEEDDIDQDTDQEPPPPPHHIFNNQETLPADIIKEPMFEKPLTPSDVGKLNRLVIPKQHAEKYFPLNGSGSGSGGGGGGGGGGGEPAGVDRGLLLSFEDESGKCWRFRYSYWNSSQSYVLTKGWSRYVKEKQLDSGDVVLFERHRRDVERLFIGWRRRGQDQSSSGTSSSVVPGVVQGSSGGVWSRGLYPPSSSSPSGHHHLPYQPDCLHAGSSGGQSQTTTQIGNPKRLRLFGVNMECQQVDESEPSTPDDGSSLSSSQGPGPGPAHHQFYSYSSSSTSHNHSIIRHN